MTFDPICEHAHKLVHTGPTWPWWLSLNAAEQGAWVAGLGAFATVLFAIILSTRDFRERQRQRDVDARALASYLNGDVIAIYGGIATLLIYLEGLRDQQIGQTEDDLNWLRNRANVLFDSKALEAKVDRFGILPNDVGERLAAATGALRRAKKSLHYVADNIRKTPPAKYAELVNYAADILVSLKKDLHPMQDYCTGVSNSRPTIGLLRRFCKTFKRYRSMG